MRRTERPLLSLPPALLIAFALLLLAQLGSHHFGQQQIETRYRELGQPLSTAVYSGLAMGSDRLLSYLLAIRLQLHDNQFGQHLRYSLIDYDLLIQWLDRISDLNPSSEYPLLLASRVYSSTGDRERLRLVLEFIERRFDDDPQLHWRRLAEASVLARHQLDDLDMALGMARKLAQQPSSVIMPRWARDFEFLLLAELNELESAIAIVEALLQTEAVDDPDERHFLQGKLLDLQQKLFESQQSIVK